MKKSSIAPLLALAFGACVPGERVSQPSPRPVAHRTVATAPAPDPAFVNAWEEAGRRALRSGLAIAPTFRERIRFPASQPHAVAYRFMLRRGERLDVRIDPLDNGGALNVDVFDDGFRSVHSGPSAFVAHADGEYVVRLQPRMGTGGLYDITLGAAAADGAEALLFPVAGGGVQSIGGWFGDARDGGGRRHEGVDIFAPHRTPVLAVAHGYVNSVRNTPTGGLVVWLTDDRRGVSYYYAHLDEQLVREGSYVSAGDTLGLVGMTGNAQGTRPHLHFGIYRPGTVAIDPTPLLRGSAVLGNTYAAMPSADELGRWSQVSGNRVRLRAAPSLGAAVVAELSAATPLFVLGGVEGWHHVVLEDGKAGFIAAEYTAARGN